MAKFSSLSPVPGPHANRNPISWRRQGRRHPVEAICQAINAKVCHGNQSALTISPSFLIQLQCVNANRIIGQTALLSGMFLCLISVMNLITFLCRRETSLKSSPIKPRHCFGQAIRRRMHQRWRKDATTSPLDKPMPGGPDENGYTIWSCCGHVKVRYQPLLM